MCGIAGFWSREAERGAMRSVINRMSEAIAHRGPDDRGGWVDERACLALGHRRLSIVDLSPLGHQPMVSPRGRYVMVFNGEVYNHQALRRELGTRETSNLRGHSDTEVMLAAIDAWGLEVAVKRFIGMFAFALWDREEAVLHLVRDRLGIKPLYYGWAGDTFLFGSELKALVAYAELRPEIDRGALTLLMRLGCIPAPYCIYRGFYKQQPGTILRVREPGERDLTQRRYWSAEETAKRGVADPFVGSDSEAVDKLDSMLRDAIALRMIADVPLGAFLSGGVDSSTVVALMQAQSDRPVRTFSIGFADEDYDEAPHARAVARHIGTDHTELYASPQDTLAVIAQLPRLYDEPFADSSQIPTFIVSQLARRHVTVALSGDGGDELFGGYNRHVWAGRIWRAMRWMPRPLRVAESRAIGMISPQLWDRLYRLVRPLAPGYFAHATPGSKLHKLARTLVASNPAEIYRCLASQWETPASLVLGSQEPCTALTDGARLPQLGDDIERMLYLDLVTYLPDDVLTKLDRASMAVSLEARVPILDHRIVEFAWRIPRSMKIRNGQSKWILRQVLHRYVPRALIDRPKAGFAMPLDSWLRGPLRPWAEALLSERRLRDDGFLDPDVVRAHWMAHLSGRSNFADRLWNVLMFQAWLDEERRGVVTAESRAGMSFAGVVA